MLLSHKKKKANLLLGSIGLMLVLGLLRAQVVLGQRGGNSNDGGDDDDFDDAGFDDSGYNQPAQRDTDSSNHSPSSSSSSNGYNPSEVEDLDDDDEVDESHVSPQVAPDEAADEAPGAERQKQQEQRQQQQQQFDQHQLQLQRLANEYRQRQQQQQQQQQQVPFLDNVQTQNFFSSPQAMLVANLHPSEAGLAPSISQYPAPEAAHLRYRRSLGLGGKPEGDIEDDSESQPDDGEHRRRLIRRKRHSKGYIGPVYTYVKTDKHANFKWGVKHKVGKHYG